MKKRVLFLCLGLLMILFFFPGAALAQGNACIPDTATLDAYKKDGTLLQRQAYYEDLGIGTTDPGLISEAKARENGGAHLRTVPSSWKSGMPTAGEAKILLIQVDFPDMSFNNGDTEEALKNIAFSPSGKDKPGYPYESLSAYYERSSYGKLTISGEVKSYTAKNNRDDYTRNTTSLFKEAMTALHDDGLDFSQFDGNADGRMDGVYIHFAGSSTGWGSPWWSQKLPYGGEAFVLDGVKFTDGVILHNPSNTEDGVHTLIHETGHMLGLADYYSYTAETYENGIKTFDMMCDNLGDHNGFSKWLLGWIDEKDITRVTADGEGKDLTLTPISDDTPSKIAVVSPQDKGIFSEYFLIQYDTPNLNNEGIGHVFPTAPASGFRIFHINATLNEDSSNFLYQNKTPLEPKLIEAVGPENQTIPFDPLFYTDTMAFSPNTTPDSSFFGGKYQSYTGAVVENIKPASASLHVRFENNPPVVSELSLSPNSPLEDLNNLPTFTFTANLPLLVNTSGSAVLPVMLEGPDHTQYPMHCAINEKTLSVGPVDAANIPILLSNTAYTLVFPENYFSLGMGHTSKEIRFPVTTGNTADILSTGILDAPSPYYQDKTAFMALPDGQLFRFAARHKTDGEFSNNYYDQLQLYATGTDLKTRVLPMNDIPNLERYTAVQGIACNNGTLALGLFNKSANTTDLYAVTKDAKVIAGPYSLLGQPTLFASDDGVKFWEDNYNATTDTAAIRLTTVDFNSEPHSFVIASDTPNATFSLFPVDFSHYVVMEKVYYGGWNYKQFFSLYTADNEKPLFKTEYTSTNKLVGAALQDENLLLFETALPDNAPIPASFSSNYLNVLTTTFDHKGQLLSKGKNIGRLRVDVTGQVSVKSSDTGIAVESTFRAPALPFLENNNDTDCRDYLFLSKDTDTLKRLSGRNLISSTWQGDQYLMAGANLTDGSVTYTQTGALFPENTDIPPIPDEPSMPESTTANSAVASSTNLPTGILGTSDSIVLCLGILALSFCILGFYKKRML